MREAIAETITNSRRVSVDPNRILVTPGAKPIISFSILALFEAGVAALPGTDFGRDGEGHFRISVATARKMLLEGPLRIRAAVEHLRQQG